MLAVGDGGVWSNLDDMAAWDAAVRARKLLVVKTWELALTPSKTMDGKLNDYGLGWSLYADKPGAPLNGFGHDGSWTFKTSYYTHLTSGRTTVVLTNRDDFDPDAFWYELQDHFD